MKPLLLALLALPLAAQVYETPAVTAQLTAAWTSATTGGASGATVVQTLSTQPGNIADGGYSTVGVTFLSTGTITGGVITFEVTGATDGNSGWQATNCYRMSAPSWDATYTLSGANQAWECPATAMQAFRVRLSTAITGSGTANLTVQAMAAPTVPIPNYTNATSLTATVNTGEITEKGPRWQVTSTPAVSTQASASKGAGTGTVRHVADCVTFSGGSTTAPAATKLNINLRDGATGAGTIIWSTTVVVLAATGQNIAPFTACGLNLVGSAATAMTLEYSALLTNLFEDVTLTGYDVQ